MPPLIPTAVTRRTEGQRVTCHFSLLKRFQRAYCPAFFGSGSSNPCSQKRNQSTLPPCDPKRFTGENRMWLPWGKYQKSTGLFAKRSSAYISQVPIAEPALFDSSRTGVPSPERSYIGLFPIQSSGLLIPPPTTFANCLLKSLERFTPSKSATY